MTSTPTKILVVAGSAEFRQTIFDLLSAAGYRVDAVGDGESGRKRLLKDEYSLLVVERGLEITPPPEVPRLDADPDDPAGVEEILARVRKALEPDEKSVPPPPSARLPYPARDSENRGGSV